MTGVAEGLERLGRAREAAGPEGLDLRGLWEAFLRLLSRRGFYVRTPAEVDASLEEIRALGEGFDLYDLAVVLAEFGRRSSASPSGRGAECLFPELDRFPAGAVPAPGSGRTKEGPP